MPIMTFDERYEMARCGKTDHMRREVEKQLAAGVSVLVATTDGTVSGQEWLDKRKMEDAMPALSDNIKCGDRVRWESLSGYTGKGWIDGVLTWIRNGCVWLRVEDTSFLDKDGSKAYYAGKDIKVTINSYCRLSPAPRSRRPDVGAYVEWKRNSDDFSVEGRISSWVSDSVVIINIEKTTRRTHFDVGVAAAFPVGTDALSGTLRAVAYVGPDPSSDVFKSLGERIDAKRKEIAAVCSKRFGPAPDAMSSAQRHGEDVNPEFTSYTISNSTTYDGLTAAQCRFQWSDCRARIERGIALVFHLTPAQADVGRLAYDDASVEWSTELRAKVAASDAERRAKAPSVVIDMEIDE
jgi:hypothetical protein